MHWAAGVYKKVIAGCVWVGAFFFCSYAVLFVLFHVGKASIDYPKEQTAALLMTINNLMPRDYAVILKCAYNGACPHKSQLTPYVRYYKKVSDAMPQRADALDMLGFCYYHLGDYAAARMYYRRSIELNPQFFWTWYNLGVLSFREKKYQEAVFSFEHALQVKPAQTYLTVQSSREIYIPLVAARQSINFFKTLDEELKVGVFNALTLLAASRFYAQEYGSVLALAAVSEQLNVAQEKYALYYYMGLAAYHLKQYERAQALFQKSVSSEPRFVEAVEWLATTLEARGAPDQAAIVSRRAMAVKEGGNGISLHWDMVNVHIY